VTTTSQVGDGVAVPNLTAFSTTHTGSLPRPPEVAARVFAAAERRTWAPGDEDALLEAVVDIVARQRALGLDVVNDGEITRLRYWDVFTSRLEGIDPYVDEVKPSVTRGRFEGYSQPLIHPEGYPEPPAELWRTPAVRGAIAYGGPGALEPELRRLRAALGSSAGFVTAPAPGLLPVVCRDEFYNDEEQLLAAAAEALAHEYRTIVDAGFLLQIDSPDLPNCWKRRTEAEGRRLGKLHLDALREALGGIPPERVRLHVCWGNDEAPHDEDPALPAFADLLLEMPVGAIVLEAANPRHAHEWRLWSDLPLGDKQLIVGAIDTTTNFVEHPELVADRLCNFAAVVGPDRVLGGTDCGFGTWAHHFRVDPRIAWAKLESLVAGARLARERLAG
jgi:5-methyltetrahydropteroyltriglutamate--homocysteine methyltransferase